MALAHLLRNSRASSVELRSSVALSVCLRGAISSSSKCALANESKTSLLTSSRRQSLSLAALSWRLKISQSASRCPAGARAARAAPAAGPKRDKERERARVFALGLGAKTKATSSLFVHQINSSRALWGAKSAQGGSGGGATVFAHWRSLLLSSPHSLAWLQARQSDALREPARAKTIRQLWQPKKIGSFFFHALARSLRVRLFRRN